MADLSEEKKLVWLGFKNPQQDVSQAGTDLQKLKDNVGDYSTYQDQLDAYDLDGDGDDEDISDFTQFKTYLEDNGFSSLEADSFIQKIKNSFEDADGDGSKYGDFETYVQDNSSSYEELQSQFGSTSGLTGETETADGEKVTGIIFHEEAGVSKDGVNVPPGTTEIIGNRIEFSQTDEVETGEPLMSYSNLAVSNETPYKYETITISCDLENIGDVSGDAYPQLKIDGEVKKAQGPIFLFNGESTTVEFEYSFDELVSVEVSIAQLEPITVTVIPTGLIR
jgi:hypothetical protein